MKRKIEIIVEVVAVLILVGISTMMILEIIKGICDIYKAFH